MVLMVTKDPVEAHLSSPQHTKPAKDAQLTGVRTTAVSVKGTEAWKLPPCTSCWQLDAVQRLEYLWAELLWCELVTLQLDEPPRSGVALEVQIGACEKGASGEKRRSHTNTTLGRSLLPLRACGHFGVLSCLRLLNNLAQVFQTPKYPAA